MMHTPTGQTAFDNIEKYQPRKKNGELVTGFRNTYKRQLWDRPGTTVTMYSREISSAETFIQEGLLEKMMKEWTCIQMRE